MIGVLDPEDRYRLKVRAKSTPSVCHLLEMLAEASRRGTYQSWRSVAAVEHVPDARFERFEESGHCPTIEEPERFNRLVSEFVASL